FKEKENIILTVGRLGTKEKNTELLLESLKEIDLKDWKVVLIGSETEELLKYKEKYFKENPDLKEKIIFTGEIKDRKELYEYYNKSKVFVLPSKWESFGIVMVEAMAFGNYVITSNTCAANDITNHNTIGKIIEIDSKIDLEKSLEEVVNGNVKLEEKCNKTLEYVKNFKYEELIKNLMLKLR
ncbi:MAG: glycosyltransferase family 4 protein, partial [Fusobacterium sp.]